MSRVCIGWMGASSVLAVMAVMTVMVMTVMIVLALGRVGAAEVPGKAPAWFVDVTEASGIDFVETIGDAEMTNIVESTGVGCGFVDYDGDGWLDL